MSLLDEGFNLFKTQVLDFNDGDPNCSVILSAVDNNTLAPDDFHQYDYHGNTGNGHGHAELDALYQFLDAIKWNTNTFHNYFLQITCTEKPCCKYCSAVMGHLGVTPGQGTYKTNRSMGVSYTIPPPLRKFISVILNVKMRRVERELQAGWA
jgi:hypothetical protein